MFVEPLDSLSKDATICNCVTYVGRDLVLLVGAAHLELVVGCAVADHDLRRILVGHHNRSDWQLGALCVGMVCVQGLFAHSDVVMHPLLVGGSNQNQKIKLTLTKTALQMISSRFGKRLVLSILSFRVGTESRLLFHSS